MTGSRKNTFIVVSAALAILASAVVLAVGLGMPIRVDGSADAGPRATDARPGPATESSTSADQQAEAELAELRQLSERNLRRPLFDPPPIPQAAAPKAPMTLALIGTANEPGHSMAIFQTSNASVVLCGIGEIVEDSGGAVTVVKVEKGKVTVRYGGELRDLEVPKSAAPQRVTE